MINNIQCTGTVLRSHHFSAILPIKRINLQATPEDVLLLLKETVRESDLKAVSEAIASFQPQGASAVIVLEESHVAVHLWPEHGLATVDIHVCDYSGDNESKARRLAQLIGARISGDDKIDKWNQLTVSALPFNEQISKQK